MDINELKKDLEEIKQFAGKATRQRVIDILSIARHKLETDIISCEEKRKQQELNAKSSSSDNETAAPIVSAPIQPKRYLVELNEYAWDQSDKFVKIFATLDGVHQKLTESDVETIFTETSIKLIIRNLNNRDYCLTIINLLAPIVIEKSYHKIKTDMIAIYMKKQKETEHWSYLTLTEKRVKDSKDSEYKMSDPDESKDDPTAGIMNLMKKMYQSGDPDTKRMIAKAWTESQEKQRETKDKKVELPEL